MDRSSFLGKYLAGFLLLGVWLAVVAADPADHAKPGGDVSDEDFDMVPRRSNSVTPGGKDQEGLPPKEGGQDDESYRRFLINALMNMKQSQWGWMGAAAGSGPQNHPGPNPDQAPGPQQQAPPPPPPPPPSPQQTGPVGPPPPPSPPPPSQLQHQPLQHQPQQHQPQQQCPQYAVLPQSPPQPMQSYAEKLQPQIGQCVTVLLPSPAMPGYNNMGPNPMFDPNQMQQPQNCRGCNGRVGGHSSPRRTSYY